MNAFKCLNIQRIITDKQATNLFKTFCLLLRADGQMFDLRVGKGVFIDRLFAQPKIRQLNVSFWVEKNILRFEVSVDDALAVQVFQSQRDFSDVETGLENNF